MSYHVSRGFRHVSDQVAQELTWPVSPPHRQGLGTRTQDPSSTELLSLSNRKALHGSDAK